MRPGDKDIPKKPEKGDASNARAERPTDPNELAKWLVEQTTEQDLHDTSAQSTDEP